MLVLARRTGEALLIGDDIVIEVLEIRGDAVKLGISAPRSIPVWRRELVAEVKEVNVTAGKTAPAKIDDLNEWIRKGVK